MNKIATCIALLLVTTTAATAEPTVEQVIAKHIDAHGGARAWQAIESMRIEGTFTAFSKTAPFVLVRQGPRYYWDTVMDGRRVVIGYDGEDLWWENHWRGGNIGKISGVDEQVTRRELDYPTPFFGYTDRGDKVRLLGSSEMEGVASIAVELTRADESVETWHLDPQTYLEIGCESTGSDFGSPRPQVTFFDDFRDVGGVKIPFLTEKQWYTRHRIMAIEKVLLNPPTEAAMFRMPPPPGMQPLLSMAGTWHVATRSRSSPDAEFEDADPRTSTIEPLLGRGMLQERTQTSRGEEVVRTLSYDRFQERYRITSIDAGRPYMNVLEGNFDEEGRRLTVSNLETDTPFDAGGMTVHLRTSFLNLDDDGFDVEYEVSVDAGENWWVATEAAYTRAE